MALDYHKRDTYKRFDKLKMLKMLEHDLALSSEKKSQNKTSQASQKPAKRFLSLILINISPLTPQSQWLCWYRAGCISC